MRDIGKGNKGEIVMGGERERSNGGYFWERERKRYTMGYGKDRRMKKEKNQKGEGEEGLRESVKGIGKGREGVIWRELKERKKRTWG